MTQIPHAFLCYGFEDTALAEKLALSMQANGIDTWWAPWCIGPGESLQQKIDEGLSDCTYFIVLLTPTSINKPWVNLEMDTGLMKSLKEHCTFIPLRYRLPVNQLPPLLHGKNSPEVSDIERDIKQLIHKAVEELTCPPGN
jgi:TIR domain